MAFVQYSTDGGTFALISCTTGKEENSTVPSLTTGIIWGPYQVIAQRDRMSQRGPHCSESWIRREGGGLDLSMFVS